MTRDDEELAGLEGSECHWRRTREAMERLGTLQSTGVAATSCCVQHWGYSDYLLLIYALLQEMMRESVREEGDQGLVMQGLGLAGEVSVFLLHEKEQPAGYWVELGVRLYMGCGMVRKER